MKTSRKHYIYLFLVCIYCSFTNAFADSIPLESINSLSEDLSGDVVAWRRDFHQNPKLSNREFRTAGIVTVGSIHGGVRSNIIREEVVMLGTIRALDENMRKMIHRRVREIAEGVSQSMGAGVKVQLPCTNSYPLTYNDPALAADMLPVLEAVAGDENVRDAVKSAACG